MALDEAKKIKGWGSKVQAFVCAIWKYILHPIWSYIIVPSGKYLAKGVMWCARKSPGGTFSFVLHALIIIALFGDIITNLWDHPKPPSMIIPIEFIIPPDTKNIGLKDTISDPKQGSKIEDKVEKKPPVRPVVKDESPNIKPSLIEKPIIISQPQQNKSKPPIAKPLQKPETKKPEPKPVVAKPKPKQATRPKAPKPLALIKPKMPERPKVKQITKKPEPKPVVAKPTQKPETKKPEPKPEIASKPNIPEPDSEDEAGLEALLKPASNGIATIGDGEQISLESAIKRQTKWHPPAGIMGNGDIIISLKISMNKDGAVLSVEITDQVRYNEDPSYRALADSAVRAVKRASPYEDLPVRLYDYWKEAVFNFPVTDFL